MHEHGNLWTNLPTLENALITVFSDASFCPETNAAGWGAWFKADGMPQGVYDSGSVPVLCASSHDAEFWGIALILSKIAKALNGRKPKAIILQCDNINALAWVRQFLRNAAPVGQRHGTHDIPPASSKIPGSMLPAIELLRELNPEVLVWLKHVKAHQRGATARSHVNERCDKLAYYQMDRKRDELKKQKKGPPSAMPPRPMPRGFTLKG